MSVPLYTQSGVPVGGGGGGGALPGAYPNAYPNAYPSAPSYPSAVPTYSNPAYSNSAYANPAYANPAYAGGDLGIPMSGQIGTASSASSSSQQLPSSLPQSSQQQQQQGMYTGGGGVPFPNLDADVATQLAGAYGVRALTAGQQYLNQNVNRWINVPAIKYYFAVDNKYVVNKLQLVLMPFRNKDWVRKKMGVEAFHLPRDDVNAPDMYIPAMAFITYMLLVGLALGQRSVFTPEVLGLTSSKAAAVVLAEVLAIKASFYILNIPGEVVVLDLIAYMGYKFVGTIVDILADILLGSQAYWIAFVYTNLALALFLMRTLRQNLSVVSDGNTGKRRRNYFLLAIAGSQVLSSYFLTHY